MCVASTFQTGRDWQVRLRLVREGFGRVASMAEIGPGRLCTCVANTIDTGMGTL